MLISGLFFLICNTSCKQLKTDRGLVIFLVVINICAMMMSHICFAVTISVSSSSRKNSRLDAPPTEALSSSFPARSGSCSIGSPDWRSFQSSSFRSFFYPDPEDPSSSLFTVSTGSFGTTGHLLTGLDIPCTSSQPLASSYYQVWPHIQDYQCSLLQVCFHSHIGWHQLQLQPPSLNLPGLGVAALLILLFVDSST